LLISIKGVVSCVVLKGPRGTTNIQLFSGTWEWLVLML
jgi:hypothetical protein